MLLKLLIITVITGAVFLALWKSSLGLLAPPVCLWGYGWYTDFSAISRTSLIIITLLHLVFSGVAWWLSNRHREACLAYTGAGLTGFATGILASIFCGPLFGFFLWWGIIGRLVVEPVSLGVRPIFRSFAGGLLKVVYGTVLAGIISYLLF